MAPADASRVEAEKRARILRTAFELCERRGVAAVRMEEIAGAAQVSKATLYRFFDSKHDLLLASIIEGYEDGLRLVSSRHQASGDPAAELDAMFDGLAKLLETTAPTVRVFYETWSVVTGDPAFRKRLDEFMQAFHRDRHRETAELIRRGQLSGVFSSDVSPEVLGQSVDALLNGYFYWATFDPESATPAALRASLDTLVRGALRPPAERTGTARAASGETGGAAG